MQVRGIEHIGITVEDLHTAEQFFMQVFGATILYRLVPITDPEKNIPGEQISAANGFPPELNLVGLSMLRLGNSCNVELFQTQPSSSNCLADPSQAGINHFSIYVDNIQAVGEKMRAHGAVMFEGPSDCFAQEAGPGNQIWFGRTPFGVLIELITLPSALHYDQEATATRWIPEA